MELKSWNIDCKYDLYDYIKDFNNPNICKINKSTDIIDLKRDNYNVIEKAVLEMAYFHLKENNIEFNPDIHIIEYWSKINTNDDLCTFHFDKDEMLFEKRGKLLGPILSCVTYLSDSLDSTLITEMDEDTFKYKKFNSQNKIFISYPRKNTQITFNGNHLHGVVNIFDEYAYKTEERVILVFNIFDKEISNYKYLTYNNYKNENLNDLISKNEEILEIKSMNKPFIKIRNDQIFNNNFYDNLFYKRINSTSFELRDILFNKHKLQYIEEIFVKHNTIYEVFSINKGNKVDKTIDNEIYQLFSEKLENNNRFLQRFVEKIDFFTPSICNWIINEVNTYLKNDNKKWTVNRHDEYATTDIPIKNITSIINFLNFHAEKLFDIVYKSYNLNKNNTSFIIKDSFIVKYSASSQKSLDMHKDGSFISLNIMLSDKSDYKGGGTIFEDGLCYKLDQGEILISSGQIKHGGLKITSGIRYIMVIFTELIFHNVKILEKFDKKPNITCNNVCKQRKENEKKMYIFENNNIKFN